jgi:hypothetical protein
VKKGHKLKGLKKQGTPGDLIKESVLDDGRRISPPLGISSKSNFALTLRPPLSAPDAVIILVQPHAPSDQFMLLHRFL